MLRIVTNCLNRVHPQATAEQIDYQAAGFTRLFLQLPPSAMLFRAFRSRYNSERVTCNAQGYCLLAYLDMMT